MARAVLVRGKGPRYPAGSMSEAPIDRELGELLELGDRILRMTLARGGSGLVAECVLRSGAELSAKVRLGEPELVEEAGTARPGSAS